MTTVLIAAGLAGGVLATMILVRLVGPVNDRESPDPPGGYPNAFPRAGPSSKRK